MMRAVVFTLAVLSICCGGGTASSPTAIDLGERLTLRVQTAHFQIFGGTSPDTTLRGAANRLEAEYSRILGNLGVSSHPVVTVRIWQDAASYYNELTRYFGTRYQAGGYITGPTELRLLAGGDLDTDVVHEFVHAVSLDVNPRFGNNPRWLWEAVALYERAVRADPSQVVAASNLGTYLMKKGRATEAMRLWSDVLARSPGLEIARMNLALARRLAGEYESAKQVLRDGLNLNPGATEMQRLLNQIR
jgi:tetratricopeptide (TPR) repeat protein